MNINIIPTGGLCNRMRAIASTFEVFEKEQDIKLNVIWNRYNGLNARFEDLFLPVALPQIVINESDRWLYNINKREDYYKRILLLKMLYKKIIYEPYIDKKDIVLPQDRSESMLIVSGQPLCKEYNIAKLFVPTVELEERINTTAGLFGRNTLGIHIRRTDNANSIKYSPLEAFHNRMREEIDNDKDVKFYLASDDRQLKEIFKHTYGERIITLMDDPSRSSLDGMKFAVVDLFCLSKTSKIIGSYYSSYSEVAANLGHIQLEYATK